MLGKLTRNQLLCFLITFQQYSFFRPSAKIGHSRRCYSCTWDMSILIVPPLGNWNSIRQAYRHKVGGVAIQPMV